MPRNGSGVYSLPAGNPVVPGTTIDTSWANSTMEDLGNELTNSLSRTGAGGMLGPLRLTDGTITAPSLAFTSETNTGLYRSGAASVWMGVLGANIAQFSSTGVVIASGKALTVQGNATVGGTFGVTGAATLSSTLSVTGAITATGGVLGNVTAASGTSTFNNVTINGDLDMNAGSSGTITNLPNPTNSGDAANKAYVDAQDALRLALTGGTMTGAIAMSNQKITGVGTPSADGDAANKAYVDSVAQGLDIKASVRAATTANISLSGTQTIDGVSIGVGDRVLVKDQSTSSQNGIYVAASSSWSRSSDADTWAELVGAFVFVEDGTTNDNSGWVCTVAPGGTLGSTAVTWEQFSGAGQVIAGTGMTKTGNTLNVNTASSSRIVVGADEIDLATTGVTASTYKSVTVDAYGRVTAGTNPTTLAGFGIGDAYTQTQVDNLLAAKLSLSGGTMTGAIAMGTYKITGLGDPTLAQDAATKNYIDTIFGSTTSAAASAAAAASSASAASTSASNASTSASNASTSATNAASSATSALSYLDTFRGQYLGASATDPTVDGNGNALTAGDLYFNTTVSEMRVYTGSAWAAAYLPAGGYLALTGGTMTGAITFSAGQTFDSTKLSGGTVTATKLIPTGNVTAGNGMYLPTTNTLAFSTNGSERMRIDSSGNVGIGTSSPSRILSIRETENTAVSSSTFWNATYGGLQINNQSTTTNSVTGIGFYGGTSLNSISAIGNVLESTSLGALAFFTGGQGRSSTVPERMRIDSAGNVGIGVAPNSAWGATRPIQLENGGSLWAWTGGLYGTNIASNVYVNSSTTPLYLLSSVAASQYQQLSGAHKWYSAPSGTADNAITWTQLLAVEKDKSLALQGATSQSGTGITFPATQSASSDANTLDDYEEGTWTPVLSNFTGTSGRTLTGTYTKIGRLVYVNVKISTGSDTLVSTANSSVITGLPFTVSGNTAFAGITNNYLETVNQGCGIYASDTVIYTVAFSFVSSRVIAISGVYEV